MPGVPYEDVFGAVKDSVKSDGELDRAEVGRQVTTRARHGLNEEGPDLLGKLFESTGIETVELSWTLDLFEQSTPRYASSRPP